MYVGRKVQHWIFQTLWLQSIFRLFWSSAAKCGWEIALSLILAAASLQVAFLAGRIANQGNISSTELPLLTLVGYINM